MNPFDVLGKSFTDVEDSLSHLGINEVFDELEDGEEQEFSVSAQDGSWEISLGKDLLIETVFLYKVDNFEIYTGINTYTIQTKIEDIFGEPSASGQQSESALLGVKGAWRRYDKSGVSVHVEREVDSEAIKMITLMLPEVAP